MDDSRNSQDQLKKGEKNFESLLTFHPNGS